MHSSSEKRLNWLLSSSALSQLGDGIGKVAFPLLAATLTRDPVLIAGLAATQFLPWLLFGVLAGAFLDRVDRKRAMIIANITRALVVGGTAGLVYVDSISIWVVYAAALLIGTAETVADTAGNVLIPSVVRRERLESANSKLQSVEIVGQTFLGGPVGSLTFAVFAAFPFLLNSVAYAVAAVLLLGLLGSYHPRRARAAAAGADSGDGAPSTSPTATGTGRTHLRTELVEGMRWLRHSPVMLRLVLVATALNLLAELAQAQLVLYALEDLELSEAAFGMFAFIGGLGGLAGAAMAPRLIAAYRRMPVLIGGIVFTGIGFTGMGFTGNPILAAILFGLFAAAVVTVNVILATLRALLVPDELLGRIIGVWRTLVWGSIPAGAMIGGFLTRILDSPSMTFAVSGGCQVLLAAAVLIMMRRYRTEINTAGSRGAAS
ncbi:MFS transporter [Haloechinothrix sp. LS1_15]|uniref:MFS transporter n=1 Tax=Haloechinothrix sp. LS1_15 TaxID=2652248 RepID=UPI002947E7DC|nr:MFS transporter [Haloechinothrix sp. LS1_15]MDV6012351.1 MFS transporter [Haloechinothrix sp. LS1_15]